MPSARLAISVVVPVHNSAETLERCLAAISAQLRDVDELIIVDDGSTDDIGWIAAPYPAVVYRFERRSGAAAARNCGATAASSPVLFFVDADVVVHDDALERGRAQMSDPSIGAVFGSYDDTPSPSTLVSQFKNLSHHYFHQRAAGDVSSFWSGCGLVRRDLFRAVGGFDERRFSWPSIEDVELGWRMVEHGARIVLDPTLQVTHLKRWTLGTMVATDVVHRAIPWVRWSLERRRLHGELNASADQRLAAVLAVGWLVTLLTGLTGIASISSIRLDPRFVWFVVITAAAFAINHRLFGLFWRKGGARLLVAGFLLQQLYYLYALTGLVVGVVLHLVRGRRPTADVLPRAGC